MDFLPVNLLDAFRRFTQPRRQGAEALVREELKWAVAIALVPVPVVDVAALTALQVRLIRRLARYYGVAYDEAQVRALVHALAAASASTAVAGAIKAVPFVGTLVGGLAMAGLAGGSTYAVGQVCIEHFETGGTLVDLTPEAAMTYYQQAFGKGVAFVQNLLKAQAFGEDLASEVKRAFGTETKAARETAKPSPKPDGSVFEQLRVLNAQYRAGEIDAATFEAKKAALLAKLDAKAPKRNGG